MPDPRRRAVRPGSSIGLRWIPTAILVAGVVVLLLLVFAPRSERGPPPARPRGGWIPLADGDTCFLRAAESFLILRRWEPDARYRVESGARAFESDDLEDTLRLFLRHRFASVMEDEPFALRIGESSSAGSRKPALDEIGSFVWAFTLSADARDDGTWYFAAAAPPPCPQRAGESAQQTPTGAPADGTSARQLQALKEKLAREISTELVFFLTSA